jgi:hypothetical protein
MIEADAPSTEEVVSVSCARPTEDSHTRTTATQQGRKAKGRARQVERRGQGHYKVRSPVGPRPDWWC